MPSPGKASPPPETETAQDRAPTAFGWLRDLPDFRDYTMEHKEVAPLVQKTGIREKTKTSAQPARVDLRAWCPPVEDQGEIGSCTAQAGVALVEYFERRAFGRHVDASRLFLYKTTRNLLRWTGDTGAYLRSTMQAMRVFGVPPEEHWPYRVARFDQEPPAFCYAYAQQFQSMKYVRLDPPGAPADDLLRNVKASLASGVPAMFGFTVFSSISQATGNGKIPFPTRGERVLGGHAVAAVGYDDALKVRNAAPGAQETTGALLVRNSWGRAWGDSGYGWIPYDYVLSGLAVDWWTLLAQEWVDTHEFG